MKKQKTNLKIIIFLVGLFFAFSNYVSAEIIRSFDSSIKINQDSSIEVKEIINYDFENQQKHGIYRNIPTKYRDRNLYIKVDDVRMDGNNVNFEVNKNGPEIEVKIGDADVLISGSHIYEINYKVENIIDYYDSFDELYWNITGNSWNIPIEKIISKIELPENTTGSIIQSSCYIGVYGSKENCNLNVSNNFVILENTRNLNVNEGVTIAVGFSKGIVFEPSYIEKKINFIFNNPIIFLPVIVFIIMFFIWSKYGKDPKGYSTIIPQYEPPKGVMPTLVGSLFDGRVNFRDITAGIIYLAEKDFIEITKVKSNGWVFDTYNYQLKLIKDDFSSLQDIEKNILKLFFEKMVIGEKNNLDYCKKDPSFKINVKKIIEEIYKKMVKEGFYNKNFQKIRIALIIISVSLVSISPVFIKDGDSIKVISIIISGLIIIAFGLFMDKRTDVGVRIKNHILGFKDFLSITEKDRLDFHNSPEKNPEKFMEFLPYAIALGVEEKWAKKFEGIYIDNPKWYVGDVGTTAFFASDFVSDFSSFSTSFNSSAGGGSASGGGGSSGGGGGGGGGGSW